MELFAFPSFSCSVLKVRLLTETVALFKLNYYSQQVQTVSVLIIRDLKQTDAADERRRSTISIQLRVIGAKVSSELTRPWVFLNEDLLVGRRSVSLLKVLS